MTDTVALVIKLSGTRPAGRADRLCALALRPDPAVGAANSRRPIGTILPLLGNFGTLIGDRVDAFTFPQRHDGDKRRRLCATPRDRSGWERRRRRNPCAPTATTTARRCGGRGNGGLIPTSSR